MNTKKINIIENKRINLQKELDSYKPQIERNRLGQFATPPKLAQDIVNYIFEKKLLDNTKIRFLDPAIGTGAFFSALIKRAPSGKIESAKGIEIDVEIAKIASNLWESYGLKVINDDFTRINPPKDNSELANLIITNPPYVRHHHINQRDKIKFQRLIMDKFGYKINGLSGLYCYFLLFSNYWLKENGFGIWLIPSEFMDVNYGITIKKFLTEKVTLIHIHRFEPNDLQFDDAKVSSSIVVFQKRTPTEEDMSIFSYGGSLQHPNLSQLIPLKNLRCIQKWTHLPNNTYNHELEINAETVTLESFFKIQRGIATGANKFFIMTKNKASSLGIPLKFLKPILPSPRDIKVDIIESDDSGFPLLDKQLVVIDCHLPKKTIKKHNNNLYDYLDQGIKLGISTRYLPRKRNPWYKQEYRKPAPFLCTYMGRNNDKNRLFRFIWNKSNAISTNVYLLLYPKDPLASILDEHPELHKEVFKVLKRIKTEEIINKGRVYGGGLHKIEPKELGRLSAQNFVELLEPYKLNIPLQQKSTIEA